MDPDGSIASQYGQPHRKKQSGNRQGRFSSRMLFRALIVIPILFSISSLKTSLSLDTSAIAEWTQNVEFKAPGQINDARRPREPAKNSVDTLQTLTNGITMIWAYNEPPTLKYLEASLGQLPNSIPVRILCASWECIDRVKAAAPHMNPSWLLARDLSQGTPLEEWVDHHVLSKLLAAHNYEDHLQVAMQLAALYKYGGKVLHLLQAQGHQELTLGMGEYLAVLANHDDSIGSPIGGLWGVTSNPDRPTDVDLLVNSLLDGYSWNKPVSQRYAAETWPIQVDFDAACQTSCHKIEFLPNTDSMDQNSVQSNRSYAVQSFNARRAHLMSQGNTGMNVGDEMQGLASIQFLPRLDAFLERDRMDVVLFTRDGNVNQVVNKKTPATVMAPDRKVHAFLNAWWGTPSMTWPPPDFVEPVTVAMHFQPQIHKKVSGSKSLEFLKAQAPVGARDTKTRSFLESHNLFTLFTACMTQTLTMRPPAEHDGKVLIVDADSAKVAQAVPENVRKTATFVTHKVLGGLAENNLLRYLSAFEKLLQYREAKLVITGRLHAALPAVAIGTPVVFLDSKKLIGGGGSRLQGLEQFMHFVYSKTDLEGFDWANPPANPNRDQFVRFSSTIKRIAACHSGIGDSARVFGMLGTEWDADYERPVCRETDEPASDSTIHIATTLDLHFFRLVFPTWIKSLGNSNHDVDIHLYVLIDSMSAKQRCLLRHMVHKYVPRATLFTIQVDLNAMKRHYKGLRHISVATQSRLYLSSLLPCVDRIIWLDLDVLVLKSLNKLWALPIPECGISGRRSGIKFFDETHVTRHHKWNLRHNSTGFNAGVMLLSLDSLRAQHFEETIVKYFGEELGMNDQFCYNNACNGTHGELPPEHNVYQKSFRGARIPPRDKWVSVHFQSSKKPWAFQSPRTFQSLWNQSFVSFDDAISMS